MPQRRIGVNVLDEAVQRMREVYEAGHRVVISFSAGKDSGACLEVCTIAHALAKRNDRIEVVMRDEEIMLPNTFEYAERVAARDEVDFHWMIANQPIINIYNRKSPYFWVFDPELPPEQWVRQPPEYAYTIPEKNIDQLITTKRFPPPEGKDLVVVMGLRVSESVARRMGLASSGGYLTKPKNGIRYARPIYDWNYSDIWRSVAEWGTDYNRIYDTFHKAKLPTSQQRVSPVTMTPSALKGLVIGAQYYPNWFSKVVRRCDGVRNAVHYGKRAVEPLRRHGETWSQCYQRTCIDTAPDWIAERAVRVRDDVIKKVQRAGLPTLPEVSAAEYGVKGLPQTMQTWKALAKMMYGGDPFSLKVSYLPYMEPEYFRKGAGYWGGKPTW